MKRLLYLANGRKPGSPARLDERFEAMGLTVDSHWAGGGEFPETLDHDGIFLSGSPHGAYEDIPFIHREHDLIREAAARGIPQLGICFGSQILASALCGRDQVFRRSHCEIGYRDHIVTPEAADDPIAGGWNGQLRMFVWHNDEVRADHPDMVILAATAECPNHIWRHRTAPAWGIQGHPEVTAETAPAWFESNRAVMTRDGGDVDDFIAHPETSAGGADSIARFAALVLKG